MRNILLTMTTLLAGVTIASPAVAQPCCGPRPVYVRPARAVYVQPAQPVYRAKHRAYRPYFRVPWSMGLHFTGVSTNHRIGDEGVDFGGMGGHIRMRGYRWGGEFSFDVLGNDFLQGSVKRVTVPLQLSAMLYLIPRGQLQVHLLGGVQAVFSNVSWNLPNLTTDQAFAQVGLHMGAGAEFFISRRVALTADIRFFGLERSDDSNDGLYYAGIDQEAVVPEKTSGVQANLGFSIYF